MLNQDVPLAVLNLSTRAHHALLNDCRETVADVARATAEELLRLPNFGRVSLGEVQVALARRGIELAPSPTHSLFGLRLQEKRLSGNIEALVAQLASVREKIRKIEDK